MAASLFRFKARPQRGLQLTHLLASGAVQILSGFSGHPPVHDVQQAKPGVRKILDCILWSQAIPSLDASPSPQQQVFPMMSAKGQMGTDALDERQGRALPDVERFAVQRDPVDSVFAVNRPIVVVSDLPKPEIPEGHAFATAYPPPQIVCEVLNASVNIIPDIQMHRLLRAASSVSNDF
ncbi:hypothetical protein [Azospirillum argentinense]|uniref:hypothetical protein n=1 Tax=Azospirillum argentinense TaxID=2970906 RepID=UPI0010BFDC8F|nr:hypothetical protein [Azospirillum argentinense]